MRGKKPMTQKEWIEKSNIKHSYFYDYSNVIYTKGKDNVEIICPIHGSFTQRAEGHLFGGFGCPKCANKKRNINNKFTTEEFIEKSKKVHNNKYSYLKTIYENKEKLVVITCNIHGDFSQRACAHLKGQGCPHCKQSNLEREIYAILTDNNIEFEAQKRFDWLGIQSLDFFIPSINVAIECQGKQHFKPIDFAGRGEEWAMNNHLKIKELDIKKNMLCELHDVKIIYYSDTKYNENIITDNETLLKEIFL